MAEETTRELTGETAIRVQDVSKLYKLYDRNRDRIRDALGLTRKKLYHEHYALHHLNFDVKKGETVGIIGTNGAGKSTILKIITGVLSPTEGNVEIDGRISALLELGAGFNMEYTGIENIYLNGTMSGFSREEIEARIPAILEFADIGEFVNQPVKTYSSGMFVRLAFAVAINIDPEILIVDEALSVGDVFFQTKCYHKFEEFKEQGRTILFVSHDMSSISQYCDRVILLDHGRLYAEGTPKEMINLYKRLMVGQAGQEAEQRAAGGRDASGREAGQEQTWKSHYEINPDADVYGDGRADIIDFAVEDENGMLTSTIEKGTRFTVKSKVRFNTVVNDPIFTCSFKDLKGVTITGTNSMIERFDIGQALPGDVYVASFEQVMSLQGGNYLLSISCTGYEGDTFVVYNRLYDIISISVISDKNTVGFYDMDSEVVVRKEK